jgi:translocation and assembly module TamB
MKGTKKVSRTLAVVAVLIVIAVSGGYFCLRSSRFRQLAIRKIVEQADRATGGRTEVRGLDFNLSTLTAHLYHVVIRGNEPVGAPPLLQVDKLTVGLKIRSVLHPKINLSELLIEHPVVHLEVDRRGQSNIPQAPPSQSSSQVSVFDLAIGHVALNGGEVNYNDLKTPVDADLYDLGTDVSFESSAQRYRGSISYGHGQLHYGPYAPLPHSLIAKFSAAPSGFSLESAVMKVASSTATLRAELTNYGNPDVSGEYDIRIHAQDFAAMSPRLKTAGDVSLTGKLHYLSESNQPWLRSVAVEGQIVSESLSAASSNGRAELQKLQGRYQLAHGSLRVNDLEAELLGGRVNADVEMQNLDTIPTSSVRMTLRRLSLRAAQAAVNRPELDGIAMSGTLDGMADASWTGNISHMRARSDLVVRGATRVPARAAVDIPVDAVVHATYDGPRNVLALHQTTVRIPSATLTAEGQISNHSNLEIRGMAGDLHQLVALVSAMRSAAAVQPLISGSGTLIATLQGSMQRPQISGRLSAQDLSVQGSRWRSAEVSLKADPSQIVVSKGSLISARRGTASFGASIALRDWSYLPSNSVGVSLSLRQMSVVDLEHLANVQYPVSGDLSGNVSLTGSQLDPRGTGSLAITNARAYDEPIQTLALEFHAESGSIISILNVATNAGSANASLTYTPKTKAYNLRLDAPSLVLEKLHTVQGKNLGVNGTLNISASGEGTVDDPRLNAVVQSPKLEARQKSIGGVKAQVHVANKQADLTVDSQVAQASVRARGHVNLTGDYETDASIDTAAIPLEVLLATYGSSVPEGFSGQTELHATLKGPLKDKAKLQGHVTIPTLHASYQALQIAAAGPIRADYVDSVLTLQPSEIRGTGTSVLLQGSFPLAGTTAPNLAAQGSIDARILRMVSPDLRSSGTVSLDIRASGSAKSPQIQGQVRLQDIAMTTSSVPLGINKLNGTLDVGSERIQISSMTADVGGGQISAGGSITYRPVLQFDVALQGNSVRLRYPDGLRSVLDSNLTLTGNMQASSLKGRVLVDALSFTPDFELASFGDQFSGNASAPAEPGFADTVSLEIAIQSKDKLSATSSQVSVEGSAELRAIGTAANPVITGRTDLTSGELFYRNVRYELQRGIITFDDPTRTAPVLNVSVTTTVEQYNLTLNLRGPFDTLTTSYTSDPPLATADIINLIARGKTSAELAASSQSTDSMIASQAASQLSGSVQKLAGISSLQIDPLLDGNNQNPSARIAMQQRVTKNFLFTFSTDVSQPGNEIVQGDYQINKRWSVSVARDQLGGVSVDGRFHTRF